MVLPGIVLRPEQNELIEDLVAAEESTGEREAFLFIQVMGKDGEWIQHSGFPGNRRVSFGGDVIALARAGLIEYRKPGGGPAGPFDITGKGLEYVQQLRTKR